MSIEELYEWAKKHNYEKLECEIQYADGGGFYYGTRDLRESDIEVKNGVVGL